VEDRYTGQTIHHRKAENPYTRAATAPSGNPKPAHTRKCVCIITTLWTEVVEKTIAAYEGTEQAGSFFIDHDALSGK
jgi:hypothetical protein